MATGFNPFDQGLSQEETQQRKVFRGEESDAGSPRTPQDTFNPFTQGGSKQSLPDPTGVPDSTAAVKGGPVGGFNPFKSGLSQEEFDPFKQGGAIPAAEDVQKKQASGQPLNEQDYRSLFLQQRDASLGDMAKGALKGVWQGASGLVKQGVGAGQELAENFGQAAGAASVDPTQAMNSEPARRMRASLLEGIAQTGRNYLNMAAKQVPNLQAFAGNLVSSGGNIPASLASTQVQAIVNQPGMVHNLLKKSGVISTTPEQEEAEYQAWKKNFMDKEAQAQTPAAPDSWQQAFSGGAQPLPSTTGAISMAADPLNYLSLGASPAAQGLSKLEAAANTASAAEKAARAAGNIMTKGGKVLETTGEIPEIAARWVTEKALGPQAGEVAAKLGAAAGPLSAATAVMHGGTPEIIGAGLEAAKRAGKVASGVGDITTELANADRINPFGRLAALAKNPDAPEWMRYAASSPVARGMASAASAVSDVAAGTLHGAAIGAALGSANTDTPEEFGESVGQMGAFGGLARGASIPAQNRARVMQKMASSAAELYGQHVAEGISPETLKKVGDSTMMTAAAAQKMFGDVKVRFLDGESGQYGQKTTELNASPGSAGFWDPTGRTIYLNADSARGADTTLLHEIAHPLFDSVVANRPELKAQIDRALQQSGQTLDQAKRDYSQAVVASKGFTDPDEFNRATDQYTARMDKLSGDLRGDPNHWIYSELMAEAGMKAMKGKNLVTDIVDPDLTTKALRVGKSALETLGVKFKTGADGQTILPNFEDTITNPALRKETYNLLRAMKEHRPGIDEAETQGVKVSPEMWGEHPGAGVHVLPNGELGNDFMIQSSGGKNIMRPNSDVRKIVRNRRTEVNGAYPIPQTEAPTTTDPNLQWRKTVSGLSERSGTQLGPNFDKLRTFSDDTKAKAHDLEQAIANGEAREGWYQQIGTGPDWRGSVSRDTGAVTAQHKQFQPINFHVDKQGNILVRNYSLGALNDKAQNWSSRHGPLSLDLWDGNVGEFKKSLKTYLDNHAAGQPGDAGIGAQKRDVINAFLVGKNVTWEKANPLRAAMRGADTQGVVRSYRLDRMETLAPHETEFAQPDYAKQVKNLSPDLKVPMEVTGPDGKKYKATYDGDFDLTSIGRGKVPQITLNDEVPGFAKNTSTFGPSLEKKGYKFELPKKTEELEAHQVDMSPDLKDPRAIRAAAIQEPDTGERYEAPMHFMAQQAAVAAGKNLRDILGWHEGFVDNSGNFLNRKQAYQRAQELGQLRTTPGLRGTTPGKMQSPEDLAAAQKFSKTFGAVSEAINMSPDEPKTFMVRHGSTEMNDSNPDKDLIRGHIDVPLDKQGRTEARAAGKEIASKGGVDHIVTSDLSRTVQTAKTIAAQNPNATIEQDPRLRPWKFGPTIEGKPTSEMLPKIKELTDNPDTRPPGGETFNEFKDRFLAGYHDAQNNYPDKNTAIVTHYRGTKLMDAWRAAGVDNDNIDPAVFEEYDKSKKPGNVQLLNKAGEEAAINKKPGLLDKIKAGAKEMYQALPVDLPSLSPDIKPREMPEDKELTRYSNRIVNLTNSKGGASFDVTSGKAPTKGFATSLYPDRTELVEKGKLTAQTVQDFARKNADLLAQPDHVIGTWNDKESGKTYLDVSYIAPNENIAKHAAEMFNQKAYWDVKGGKEVPTGGSGEPMENMPAALERVPQAKSSFEATQQLPQGEVRGPVPAALPEGTDKSRGRVRTLQESQHLSLQHVKDSPDMEGYAKKIVEQFRTQPGFRDIDPADTNKALDEIDKRVQSNLQFLYDRATPENKALWKQWYDFAHEMSDRWGKEYGVHGDVVSAINARLSPQMEWNNNVSLTRTALDTIKKNPTVTEADIEYLKEKVKQQAEEAKEAGEELGPRILARIEAQLQEVSGMKVGDKMSDLNDMQAGMLMRSHNELYNARAPLHDHNLKKIPGDYLKWAKPFDDLKDVMSIWRDPSFENVSENLGGNHKVRSFYNNHVAPESPLWTTIDTHAVAAGNLYPYGGSDKAVTANFGNPNHKNTGYNGVYPLYQDAYEKVAEKNGILPRELQSIVWEQMRKELNPAAKRVVQKLAEKGESPFPGIWEKVEKGELSREDAQKMLVDEMAKFNAKAQHGKAARDRAAGEQEEGDSYLRYLQEQQARQEREFKRAQARGNEPIPERASSAPQAEPIRYGVAEEPF